MPEPRFEIKGKERIRIPVEGPNGTTMFREIEITYIDIPKRELTLNPYEARPDAIQTNVSKVPEIDFTAQIKQDEIKKNLIKRIKEYKGWGKSKHPIYGIEVDSPRGRDYGREYNTLFKLIEEGALTLDKVPNDLYFSSLKRDFDKYFEIFLPYHLYVQRKARLGEPLVADGEKGITLAIISGSLSVGSDILYDQKTGQWYSPKQGKYYGSKFYGNQYTPKQKTITKGAKWMDKGGKFLGGINAVNTIIDWRNDKISTGWFIAEEASNAFSTLGGVYGAAWGIGWELGRLVTEQDWYNEMKEQWLYERWRKENLGY